MFGPRLSPESLNPPRRLGVMRSGGELADKRDVAPFDEWGHAVDAPTDTEPEKHIGLPPFTP